MMKFTMKRPRPATITVAMRPKTPPSLPSARSDVGRAACCESRAASACSGSACAGRAAAVRAGPSENAARDAATRAVTRCSPSLGAPGESASAEAKMLIMRLVGCGARDDSRTSLRDGLKPADGCGKQKRRDVPLSTPSAQFVRAEERLMCCSVRRQH